MATLADEDKKFGVRINPRYINWWTYRFEFLYEGKPIFNREIFRGDFFEADEYESSPLLPVLNDVANCTERGRKFSWDAWETEVDIDAEVRIYDEKGLEPDVEITFFIGDVHFVNSEMNYGDHRFYFKMTADHGDFKKFYEDLKAEMAAMEKI